MSQMHLDPHWITLKCFPLLKHGYRIGCPYLFLSQSVSCLRDCSYIVWPPLSVNTGQCRLHCSVGAISLAVLRSRCHFEIHLAQGPWQANCDRFLQQLQWLACTSRWLNNPAFWPACVFGLEPFPWNGAERNMLSAHCLQHSVCGLRSPLQLWNVLFFSPGHSSLELSQMYPWKYKNLPSAQNSDEISLFFVSNY